MFVRIIWTKNGSHAHAVSGMRHVRPLPTKGTNDLGIPAADFAAMTKGLFDKPQ